MRGLCGKKTQAWEMWPNGWPDWHQLWCTHADSSRKGSWPKKISGGIGGAGGCAGVYPSKHIHIAVCGPIGTKFGTHMQIHLEKVVGKIKICPVSPRGNLGGFRGPEIQKSGKTTKRMDQLAPNLAHVCGFIWEWT